MSNWISFGGGYPPFEMLLKPCSNDEHPSLPFSLYPGDQFVDFFGGEQRSPPPPPPTADPGSGGATDGQDSSSSLTIYQDTSCQAIPVAIPVGNSEVEESVEAGGNRAGLNGQSPESVCELTAGEGKEVAVTMAVTAGDGKASGVTTAMTVVGSGQRSSVFRGVTRHRWTGRYEAHLWDNTCRLEGQKRKGRQVYLGGYDKEEKAARAYDLAALKYWGVSATTNFPATSYSQEMEIMKNMTKQEFIASIRRNSSGFSRGASIYRGVTRHHQHGRWQARIGRVAGNKDLYLGTFSTQEEAAEAYDVAAIKFRGSNAVTNFSLSRYDVEAIANSELPIGMSSAKRMKKTSNSSQLSGYNVEAITNMEAAVGASNNRVKLQALVNNSTALTVTTANAVSNFELSRYNSEAIANNEVPLGELAKWMSDAFPANSTHQVLLANSTTSTLEHPNNEPSAPLHNHFQLQSSTAPDPSISLAFYGLGDGGSPDLCGQNFYWPLAQQSSQIHCGQIAQGGSEVLQLTF